MDDLFEKDEEIQGVTESSNSFDIKDKYWWVGKKCTFCGGDKKLWVSGNGLIRCEKCYKI